MKDILRYKNILLDFDGTICNLKVDWKGLKEVIFYEFSKSYQFPTGKLMDMINVVYENNIDHRTRITQLIKEFEQPQGKVNYSGFNHSLLQYVGRFSIVSNNLTSTIEQVLTKENYLAHCHAILGVDNVSRTKPSCIPFEMACTLLSDQNPENYLFIGDSDTDRIFALNSNIEFIHINDINL